jgi:branched-chain amino acid transport system ATP-binding protein
LGYGAVRALQGVSLTVAPGEIVTLIGSNGAGTSTLLRCIIGLVTVESGTIVFDKTVRLDRLPAHTIVREGISHAPEGRQIVANLPVRENLERGAYQRKDREGIRETMVRLVELLRRARSNPRRP